jgi:hypothetical protein
MRPVLLQAIHIKLMPSTLLLGLVGGVSIASCAILLSLPIPLFIKLAIIALIIASSAFFILRDALLVLSSSWKTIDVDNKGELTMINKSGQQFQLIPASSSFIHAACTILNFKRNGFRLALPPAILFTSIENENELRRLRVWLRWFKHKDVRHQGDFKEAEELDA